MPTNHISVNYLLFKIGEKNSKSLRPLDFYFIGKSFTHNLVTSTRSAGVRSNHSFLNGCRAQVIHHLIGHHVLFLTFPLKFNAVDIEKKRRKKICIHFSKLFFNVQLTRFLSKKCFTYLFTIQYLVPLKEIVYSTAKIVSIIECYYEMEGALILQHNCSKIKILISILNRKKVTELETQFRETRETVNFFCSFHFLFLLIRFLIFVVWPTCNGGSRPKLQLNKERR